MSTYSVDLACHPHRLTLWEGTKETFRCSLCRCHGYGSFYRCSNSDCSAYQIHDSCAHAPDSLSFVGHAQHPLALLPEIKGGSGYCCDLCTYCITGVYYGCHACAFFVHPVCARLPPSTVSPVHPQHLVTLIPGKGYNYSWDCSSCSRRCGGWHYACAPCRVRLHPWCLLGNGNNYENFPLCICRT